MIWNSKLTFLTAHTRIRTYVVFNIYFVILSRIDAGRACSIFTLFEKISPLLVDHPSHTQSGYQTRSQTALLVRFSTYKSISGRTISISRREYMETAIQNSHWKFLSIIKSRVFWTVLHGHERKTTRGRFIVSTNNMSWFFNVSQDWN
jgi:hypothetical protein